MRGASHKTSKCRTPQVGDVGHHLEHKGGTGRAKPFVGARLVRSAALLGRSFRARGLGFEALKVCFGGSSLLRRLPEQNKYDEPNTCEAYF